MPQYHAGGTPALHVAGAREPPTPTRLARRANTRLYLTTLFDDVHRIAGRDNQKRHRRKRVERHRPLVIEAQNEAAKAVAETLKEQEGARTEPLLHLDHGRFELCGQLLGRRAVVPCHILPEHGLQELDFVLEDLRAAHVLHARDVDQLAAAHANAHIDQLQQHCVHEAS